MKCIETWCSNESTPPFKTCERCRERCRKYGKEHREELKKNGLCPRCKGTPTFERTYCDACIQARQARKKAERQERAAEVKAGLRCSSCLRPKTCTFRTCKACRGYDRKCRRQGRTGESDTQDRIMVALEDGMMPLVALADKAGVTTRTVLRHMAEMTAKGWIKAIEVETEDSFRKEYMLVKYER